MRSKLVLSILIYLNLVKCNFADESASDAMSPLVARPTPGEKSNHSQTAAQRQARQVSGIHFYPGSPVYDSLLTRRTFIPSFRMVLLELSLMTLGVFVMNAVENMMHAGPKPKIPHPVKRPQPPKNRYKRALDERYFHLL